MTHHDTKEDTMRVLVPLDGSAVAEEAIPVAERLVQTHCGSLVLARIVPPLSWALHLGPGAMPPMVYQQLLDDEERAARNYLEDIASRLRQRGIAVRTVVEGGGDVATHLIDLEDLLPITLVVMASRVPAAQTEKQMAGAVRTRGRDDLCDVGAHAEDSTTGAVAAGVGIADRIARCGHVPVVLVPCASDLDDIGMSERAGIEPRPTHGVSAL